MERVLGGLYISSYPHLLTNRLECEENNITHIVSVFKGTFPPSFNKYTLHSIPVDDLESTNIIEWFDDANDFINKALFPGQTEIQRGVKGKHEANVVVICQAGESRSVVVLASYLMKKYNLNPEQALHAIQRKRPHIHPNESFREQLELYYAMDCVLDKDNHLYRQWLLSHSTQTDPTGRELLSNDSTFIDESKVDISKSNEELTQLRCKRCRQPLALSTSFVPHVPPGEESKQSRFVRKVPNSKRVISVQSAASTCSHYFVEPLNWMKDDLQNSQELEGKFQCPKCDTKVGAFNWKGSRCSCGKWMVPAIHLQRAKVDEIKLNHQSSYPNQSHS